MSSSCKRYASGDVWDAPTAPDSGVNVIMAAQHPADIIKAKVAACERLGLDKRHVFVVLFNPPPFLLDHHPFSHPVSISTRLSSPLISSL